MPTDIKVLQIYTDFRTFAADFECMGIVFPFS